MSRKEAIIVLGKPGSGKGTQAKLLADRLDFFYFSSSAIGKEYITTHNDLESKEQSFKSDKGILWDSTWILKVVEEKTGEIFSRADGIVYDGFPRDLFEAERFLLFLTKLFGKENVKIIELEVSDKEVRKRISKRLVCSKNPQHLFVESGELRVDSDCPEGDGLLAERIDDSEERLKVRFDEYYKNTAPGIEFLKNNYSVIVIQGEGLTEDIHKNIVSALNYDNHKNKRGN